jgi:hypothetical protein
MVKVLVIFVVALLALGSFSACTDNKENDMKFYTEFKQDVNDLPDVDGNKLSMIVDEFEKEAKSKDLEENTREFGIFVMKQFEERFSIIIDNKNIFLLGVLSTDDMEKCERFYEELGKTLEELDG